MLVCGLGGSGHALKYSGQMEVLPEVPWSRTELARNGDAMVAESDRWEGMTHELTICKTAGNN